MGCIAPGFSGRVKKVYFPLQHVLSFFAFCGLLVAVAESAKPPGDVTRGEELYQERCILCHGAAGQGWDWEQKVARPPVPVPHLPQVVPLRSDAELMLVIRDGGEAVGLTRFMPAFGFNMTEQDLRDVVSYLRALPLSTK